MLTETADTLALTADTGRGAPSRRLLAGLGIGSAAIGAALLAWCVWRLVDGIAPAAAVGAVAGLALLAVAGACLTVVQTLQRTERNGLILAVEPGRVVTPGGPIPASALRRIRLRSRRFALRTRHPVTAEWEARTGTGTHRTIVFERTDGAVERVHAAVFATDDEFARVVRAVLRFAEAHTIPVQRGR
ncbi:hypothetical protein GCM10025768_00060 [Microbacterium pseudoresistens]|uniref:Uncharacterized protein n=1 Tax=Microbacterium pseudoresistens TaxID=640634 RepID=A0A7Y9JLL6_9MICO|nr:hypothetical protein [Microbacterium pseudoresistens]NYD53842.1 hypothetical protein [Microbacterium pseudoresistens]